MPYLVIVFRIFFNYPKKKRHKNTFDNLKIENSFMFLKTGKTIFYNSYCFEK